LHAVFGDEKINLSDAQKKIIIFLYKTGGAAMQELKQAAGYNADSATHSVDTLIYELRKTFGKDFIKYENGIYKL
jgi:DNA-binding response OmpR family regulator